MLVSILTNHSSENARYVDPVHWRTHRPDPRPSVKLTSKEGGRISLVRVREPSRRSTPAPGCKAVPPPDHRRDTFYKVCYLQTNGLSDFRLRCARDPVALPEKKVDRHPDEGVLRDSFRSGRSGSS